MKYLLKGLEILLPITAVILLVFQVIISNELATLGKKLGQLDVDVRLVSDTRESLSIEVASASSLLALRERAFVQGFVEPTSKQILNVSLQVPVALDMSHTSTLRPIE